MISAQVGEKRMLVPKMHKYSLFRVRALLHAIFNGIGQERKNISLETARTHVVGAGIGGEEATSKAMRESRRCVSQKRLDLHGDCVPIFRYDGAYRNGGDCGAPSSLAPRGAKSQQLPEERLVNEKPCPERLRAMPPIHATILLGKSTEKPVP